MNKNMLKSICFFILSSTLLLSFGFSASASQPNVDFIDVSHHNNETGLPLAFYQTIKNAGVNAVAVKVSEDRYFVDPAASVNIANAKQAGMIVHAYHYARYTSNEIAQAEAQWFDTKLNLVGFDKNKDGYVVVDVEAANLSNSPAKLTEYTNTFIQEMRNLGYTKIDVYSGSYFYNIQLLPSSLLIDKPWLAAYPANPIKGQPTANFSNGVGAWQWASDYRFSGLSSYGDFDVSEDYAGKYMNQVNSSSVTVQKIEMLSLVDYMKAAGMDASFSHRSTLAEEYGIPNYSGTSAQNLALLSKLKSGMKPAQVNFLNSQLKPLPDTPAVASTSTYVVRKDDTLSGIANKFHLSLNYLASINRIQNKNFIRTGQVLMLSGGNSSSPTSSAAVYHIVHRGETVSELALMCHSSVQQIKSWNRLNSKYTIYIGEKLRVK